MKIKAVAFPPYNQGTQYNRCSRWTADKGPSLKVLYFGLPTCKFSVECNMYSLQCAVEQVPGLHIAGPAQYRPNGLGISEDWLGIEETYMKRRKCGKFP